MNELKEKATKQTRGSCIEQIALDKTTFCDFKQAVIEFLP